MADEVDWLVSAAEKQPGPEDDFFGPLLDYSAEDRYLDGQRKLQGDR